MMQQHVLGGVHKAPFLYSLTREGRLVNKFHALKARDDRPTPAVTLKGDDGLATEVVSAPALPGGVWTLFGGRQITTDQIDRIDIARELAGYV